MPNNSPTEHILLDKQFNLIDFLTEHAEERFLDKDTVLYHEGDPLLGVYYLLEGRFVHKINHDSGRTLTLSIVESHNFVGEIESLENKSYQTTCYTNEKCKVLYIDKEKFFNLMSNNGNFSVHIALSVNRKLMSLHQKVENLVFSPIQKQLLCLLHRFSIQAGPDAKGNCKTTIYITQQQLADLLGVTRICISQEISILKQKKSN